MRIQTTLVAALLVLSAGLEAEGKKGEDCGRHTLLIGTFQNRSTLREHDALAAVIPLLLEEYLQAVKVDAARTGGGRSTITGTIEKDKVKKEVRLSVRYLGSDGQGVGDATFPVVPLATANDLVFQVIEQASQTLPHLKVKKEKILPYLYRIRSPEALALLAQAKSALAGNREQDARRAVPIFEKAIEKDYNFVPAYLGLAEAYALLSLHERMAGLPDQAYEARALREFRKAEILHPPLAELKEKRILGLLRADNLETRCDS